MIIDRRENAALYASLLPGLEQAFKFLARPGLGNLPDGRHAIDGELATLAAGDFAQLPPHDAHQPGLADDHPATVNKIVVKIGVMPS